MHRKILPHAAIILSAMYLVFYAIDRVNPAMCFIDNNITKALLLVLCAVSVANAVMVISYDRWQEWRRWRQSRKRRKA